MKKLFSRLAVSGLVLILFLLLPFGGMAAEKYPSRTITVIIPFSGVGVITNTIRALAPILEKDLGVPFVVVEKAGGGGAVGWRALQSEPPDGYTLGAASKSLYGATYNTKGKVDYKNFDPVVMLCAASFGITVNTESPWKDLKAFIKSAKESPGKIRAATAGTASLWHIALLAFNKAAGVDITHIPFKSGGECFTAVLGNHIESTFSTPSDFPGALETGKLRILAIGSEKRSPYYPDVPTVKEAAGLDLVMGNWWGVIAPKGVPKDRMEILDRAFAKAVKSPQYLELMKNNKMGSDFVGSAEFRKFYLKDAEVVINYTKSIVQ